MNTLEDFHRLSAALVGYDLPVRIGFEATGNYHSPLAHHLGQAGFELKLVSSAGLARTREALHNSWDKNDPKDAQVIQHMLEIGAVQFFRDPLVVGTADIQELSKTHEIVSRSKTELWHRILTHYLPLYFPEAERFHRSSRTDWFLAFLEKYPTPAMITAMSQEAFIADAGRKSRAPKRNLIGANVEPLGQFIALIAASATFALKAGLWFRWGRLLLVSIMPISGRNSTHPKCPLSENQL